LFARLVLLSVCVGAAPVQKIVRREQFHLASSGEFVEVKEARRGTKDYSNWDFPLGEELSDECPDGSVKLREKEDCEEAAIQAGLQYITVAVEDEEYKWVKPKGCFMELCPEAGQAGQAPADGDGNGPCYRWNPVEPGPNNITGGRPVCHRERVKYGTIVDKEIKCPENYRPVEEEDLCLQDGKSLGDSDADQSLINKYDANKYDDYPLYCFLDKPSVGAANETDAAGTEAGELLQKRKRSPFPKVYFNEPLPNIDPAADPPKNPVGTPICNVTSITWFDKDGALTPLLGCVRDEHNECVTLPFITRTTH